MHFHISAGGLLADLSDYVAKGTRSVIQISTETQWLIAVLIQCLCNLANDAADTSRSVVPGLTRSSDMLGVAFLHLTFLSRNRSWFSCLQSCCSYPGPVRKRSDSVLYSLKS